MVADLAAVRPSVGDALGAAADEVGTVAYVVDRLPPDRLQHAGGRDREPAQDGVVEAVEDRLRLVPAGDPLVEVAEEDRSLGRGGQGRAERLEVP